MSKPSIDFEQFSLAPRRKATMPDSNEDLAELAADRLSNNADAETQEASARHTVLPRLPEEERQRRSAKRAAEQEDSRRRLKNLKRAKDRAMKFFVNVPLEQDVKRRLMRAAHENDVKMTVIMQAAIETYLEDNGY